MKPLIIGLCAFSFFCIAGCGNEAGQQSNTAGQQSNNGGQQPNNGGQQPSTEHQYVVYEFWAEWCGPCKAYAPTFEKLQAKLARPNVTFKRVNVDDDMQTAAKFKINSIPAVVVTADGKEVARFNQATESQLLNALR